MKIFYFYGISYYSIDTFAENTSNEESKMIPSSNDFSGFEDAYSSVSFDDDDDD